MSDHTWFIPVEQNILVKIVSWPMTSQSVINLAVIQQEVFRELLETPDVFFFRVYLPREVWLIFGNTLPLHEFILWYFLLQKASLLDDASVTLLDLNLQRILHFCSMMFPDQPEPTEKEGAMWETVCLENYLSLYNAKSSPNCNCCLECMQIR